MSSSTKIEPAEKPWRAVGTVIYTDDGGFDIRNLPNAGERAELIVTAVNSHADLVKALEAAPIMSKYHGMRGFETERFIADYESWREIARTALSYPVGREELKVQS